MIQDLLEFAKTRTSEGKQVALVTVTETSGSSPASVGQIMAVSADGTSVGTVGGGASEYRLIQRAVRAIAEGERVFHFSFDHAENGMVCGGSMSGFGNILGNENHLLIFGGGHIAQSLAPLGVATGFDVTVVEEREELAAQFKEVHYIVCEPSGYQETVQITKHTYVVICTRGHQLDAAALRYCLTQESAYLGMIGSSQKVGTIFDTLREEGIEEKELEKIYTPIGLDIASSIPAEIAVSILAEILLVKNNGMPRHRKERKPY
ncbi:MAG: XdhC/CoxI family protein [Lachnospiraceae bacterium]